MSDMLFPRPQYGARTPRATGNRGTIQLNAITTSTLASHKLVTTSLSTHGINLVHYYCQLLLPPLPPLTASRNATSTPLERYGINKIKTTKNINNMPSSDIDKVVDGFPHPTIFPITGMPNYEALSELNLKLNSNASSVHSDLRNGQLGLLALTVLVAVYNMLSNIPFVPPPNPGPTTIIPAIATAAQISNLRRLHAEALARFREYIAIDKALKQQLITAIQPMYLRALSNRIIGFAPTSPRVKCSSICMQTTVD
jgi:hypothetical protein